MARFGFVGGTYTARSSAVADEEAINWFVETDESGDGQASRSLFGTPGTAIFATLADSPVRGIYYTGSRLFAVGGTKFVEIASDGTQTARGDIATDGKPVSIAASNTQLFIVSAGHAYCFTFKTNVLTEVTPQMLDTPKLCEYSDGYFLVLLPDKFQISGLLDGENWPGAQVIEVSVFPENLVSFLIDHRELTVWGSKHSVVYYNSGSTSIFDPISGSNTEVGAASAFGRSRLDNSFFWIGEDERGGRIGWRADGYTPRRVTTHAVESEWSTYPTVSDAISYSYQDGGHAFWVVYFPSANYSWVYDVAENLWHKRAYWNLGKWEPHHSQCHAYAFGKHLVGDWSTGNVYWMDLSLYDDAGQPIRRLRRSPTIGSEMEWMFHENVTVDFATGVGPQPPLQDGSGNARAPQAILRWSDNRGSTWSNDHVRDCGQAGQFRTRVIWRRLGRSRYRVYELTVSDPVPWVIVDAYLQATPGYQLEERLTTKLKKQS